MCIECKKDHCLHHWWFLQKSQTYLLVGGCPNWDVTFQLKISFRFTIFRFCVSPCYFCWEIFVVEITTHPPALKVDFFPRHFQRNLSVNVSNFKVLQRIFYFFLTLLHPLVGNQSIHEQATISNSVENLIHPNCSLTQCPFDSVITWVESSLADIIVRQLRQRKDNSLTRKNVKECRINPEFNSLAESFAFFLWAGIIHFLCPTQDL